MNIIWRNINWIVEKCVGGFYKRDKNLWVFGEWFGKRCCDNSLYMANYVVQNHPEIQAVWISQKEVDLSLLSPKVKWVERHSPEAVKILKHAGVVIYNQSLQDFTDDMHMYCAGAVRINLMHGVPWKKIGIDAFSRQNKLRWLYANYILRLQRPTAYLAVADNFAGILKSAFLAKEDGLIKAGYPRNAIFYDAEAMKAARSKVEKALEALQGTSLSPDTKIITYMPTFRDQDREMFTFEQLEKEERFLQILQKHNAIIVQKMHFVDAQKNTSKEAKSVTGRVFRLNSIGAMELLAASDLLITDYSSCFFDYLLTDRPMIHYLYDYAYYEGQDRGLYYPRKQVVCGNVAENVTELLTAMESNLENPGMVSALRKERRAEYMTYESADSCKKIFEAICKRL